MKSTNQRWLAALRRLDHVTRCALQVPLQPFQAASESFPTVNKPHFSGLSPDRFICVKHCRSCLHFPAEILNIEDQREESLLILTPAALQCVGEHDTPSLADLQKAAFAARIGIDFQRQTSCESAAGMELAQTISQAVPVVSMPASRIHCLPSSAWTHSALLRAAVLTVSCYDFCRRQASELPNAMHEIMARITKQIRIALPDLLMCPAPACRRCPVKPRPADNGKSRIKASETGSHN